MPKSVKLAVTLSLVAFIAACAAPEEEVMMEGEAMMDEEMMMEDEMSMDHSSDKM